MAQLHCVACVAEQWTGAIVELSRSRDGRHSRSTPEPDVARPRPPVSRSCTIKTYIDMCCCNTFKMYEYNACLHYTDKTCPCCLLMPLCEVMTSRHDVIMTSRHATVVTDTSLWRHSRLPLTYKESHNVVCSADFKIQQCPKFCKCHGLCDLKQWKCDHIAPKIRKWNTFSKISKDVSGLRFRNLICFLLYMRGEGYIY